MKMTITQHCSQRMDERGRRSIDLRVTIKYGERLGEKRLVSRNRANATIKRLYRWLKTHSSDCFQQRAQKVRQLIRLLERAVNWMVVVASNSASFKVVTVYPVNSATCKKFMTTIQSTNIK